MKYSVGQKVKIKSLDWYNENKDEYGNIDISHDFTFFADRSKYCGKVFTINVVFDNCYTVKEDNHEYYWTDEMIEGLVEEEDLIPKFGEYSDNEPLDIPKMTTDFIKEIGGLPCPEGYIFKDENGNVINATKIVLEKKKKEYPKTYEECCKVLGVDPDNYLTIRNVHCYDGEEETIKYEKDLLDKFDSLWELRICRDAYWKIAGEEMRLGKPWEPDWNNVSDKYCIYFVSGYAWSKECQTRQCPFAFPTPEMRDAFKTNFDPDIEICKELL